jgi:hypothetical protein
MPERFEASPIVRLVCLRKCANSTPTSQRSAEGSFRVAMAEILSHLAALVIHSLEPI